MSIYHSDSQLTLHNGDALEVLRGLPSESVNCCVTSPPYFGLRDYGVDGQIGLEPTPEEFIARLVDVFREVRRVLKDDGTCWVNIGDSYAQDEIRHRNKECESSTLRTSRGSWSAGVAQTGRKLNHGLKNKDLIGIPWLLAFALRADGWFLRQDIIWSKPNPMPESVTDRCTKAHEYVFLLSKSARYFYDHETIKEHAVRPGDVQTFGGAKGRAYDPKPDDPNFRNGTHQHGRTIKTAATANKRSVWSVATKPYASAHFATYPPELIRPCILAGCPAGGVVLDPFAGSGTTAQVANAHGRKALLIELNPEYCELIIKRNCQKTIWAIEGEAA